MDWKEIVEAWDEAVAKAGKGQRVNLSKIGDQKAIRELASCATNAQVLARAEVMFSEEWREYFTIASLWNSWEALGEKGAELERQRKINSQAVGNPPTKIEEIRKVWSEPPLRPGDKAHQELTKWLKESGERIVAASKKRSSGDALTDRIIDVFDGELLRPSE